MRRVVCYCARAPVHPYGQLVAYLPHLLVIVVDAGGGLLEPVAGSEGEPTTSSTSTDDTTTTTGDLPTGTSGATTDTDPSEPTATTTSSTSTTGEDVMPEPEVWDGEKLPWEDFGRWTWVPFPDSQCRDGSSTGIWLRYGKGPGLAIFFEGGGACFNALTCANNDASFDYTWAFGWEGMGLFDADWTDNPIHDWNIVYVPYCTGDVHSGDRTDVEVPGVEGLQQFVGYRNVTAYLDRVVPTFEAAPNVLVTGVSAGASAPASTTTGSRAPSPTRASPCSTTPARRSPTTCSRRACSSSGATCGASRTPCPRTATTASPAPAAASSTSPATSARSTRSSTWASSPPRRT
ncbi:pectin acetylesterase-family hydrolase [Nannocystis pusilla]|uniref:pectin acetylesterase-family hydrolase n=1 Tax=Nannocystis pusilla TaxID=889268 RepID=UPI003B7D4433